MSLTFTFDQAWIEAVALASVRFVAFVIIAPPFSYKAFPGRVKAMVAVGLALAVSPRIVGDYQPMPEADFILALLGEFATGAALGFLVYVAFTAVQAAGDLIDVFGGFQIAQGFDPGMNINGAQFSRLFGMAAIALMLSTGAYQVVFAGLWGSFDALPIGAILEPGVTAEAVVRSVSAMLVAAIQIAGPLVIILFLADAGLGLLNRVAPALNVFAMGFPLKILLVLSLCSLVLVGLPQVVAALADSAMRMFGEVIPGE